jgi:hypothetical protein
LRWNVNQVTITSAVKNIIGVIMSFRRTIVSIISTFAVIIGITSCATKEGSSTAIDVVEVLMPLETAILNSIEVLKQEITMPSKIAVLNFIHDNKGNFSYIRARTIVLLSEENGFTIANNGEISRLERELRFSMEQKIGIGIQQSIGKAIGAQIVISGELNEQIFSVQVLDVESGNIIASYSEKVTDFDKFNTNDINEFIGFIGLEESNTLIYGVGSFRGNMAMAITAAEARSRADIIVKYNNSVSAGRGTTRTTANAIINDSKINQRLIDADSTVWYLTVINRAEFININGL